MTFTRQLNEREQEAIRNIQRQAEQNNARMLGAVQQAQEQPRGNGIRVLDPGEANRQDMERVARPLHPERLPIYAPLHQIWAYLRIRPNLRICRGVKSFRT